MHSKISTPAQSNYVFLRVLKSWTEQNVSTCFYPAGLTAEMFFEIIDALAKESRLQALSTTNMWIYKACSNKKLCWWNHANEIQNARNKLFKLFKWSSLQAEIMKQDICIVPFYLICMTLLCLCSG